jgi:hypothetical protein
MTDPDGTIPNLTIVGGNDNGWFTVAGHDRIAFAPNINFSAEWLRGTFGLYGQEGGFFHDTDNDGLKEIKVATLILKAADELGPRSESVTYDVMIEDINEAPVFSTSSNLIFDENPGYYQLIGGLSPASDIDGPAGELRYVFSNWNTYVDSYLGRSVAQSADGKFVMDMVDGRIWVNGSQTLDAEAVSSLTYQTMVYDRALGAHSAYSYGQVSMTLQNVNDNATRWGFWMPRHDAVMENTAAGTVLFTANAYDPDGFALTYSIDPASNPNGAFGINQSGQIYVAAGVDYEAAGWLEDGSGKYVNLKVRATDGGAPAEATVKLRLANQILQVRNADGSLTGRYRSVIDIVNRPAMVVPEGMQDDGYTYELRMVPHDRIRYIDNVSGAVVLSDVKLRNEYRQFPHPDHAMLAHGFRWTGNNLEIISDDEHNGWSLAPIVLDLADIGLAAAFGPTVAFDVDGQGQAEQVEWINPQFAFLALDRDGDGVISSGLEISFAQDKPGARTDLEGLAAYDSDGDGILSSGDERFGAFRVWQDSDSDGVSDAGELKSLADAGIVSIDLKPVATGDTLANVWGNVIVNTAHFTRADGRTGTLGDAILRPAGMDGVVSLTSAAAANEQGTAGAPGALTRSDGGRGTTGDAAPGSPPAQAREEGGVSPEALAQVEALCSSSERGLADWIAAADPFNLNENAATLAARRHAPSLGGGSVRDKRVAQMIQDMATFGVRAGEDGRFDRNREATYRCDFFA